MVSPDRLDLYEPKGLHERENLSIFNLWSEWQIATIYKVFSESNTD